MNLRHPVLAAMAAVLITGCASRPGIPEPEPPATLMHQYQVRVVGVEGAPIANVAVKLSVDSRSGPTLERACVTDEEGFCELLSYQVNRDRSLTNVTLYPSRLRAEAQKAGYYSLTVTKRSTFGSSTAATPNAIEPVTLTMVRPINYLDDSLANSASGDALRRQVLAFIEVVRDPLLKEAPLLVKGIGISEFQGQKYLRVAVSSPTIYDTLKLNKHEIGAKLLDDLGRKVLVPLNAAVEAPEGLHGYDLKVLGRSRNYVNRYSRIDKVEYRFLVPEASVRQYKTREISSQALMAASVVLLGNERIGVPRQ